MLFAHSRMLLLAAIAVPLLILFFWWTWRKRMQLTQQFVQSRLLAQLTVGVSRSAQKFRMGLLVAAVTLLFVALARPMWGQTTEEVRQRGLDIIVAIDTSRSMLAEDVSPNRLARAKLAALDLMQLAKRDRLGLVAFAGTAFLQCPLTLDEEAFRQSVNALDVGIIPQGGTALAEAIETALDAFKTEGDNFKVLVAFTDGEDHEAGALEAAEQAAAKGLRVFTVGVGTPNGELLPVRDEQGRRAFVKDDQGNVVKSRSNEKLLTQVATATGGFYLGLSGANTMDVLYRQGLEPLPRSETATKMIRQHKDQYMWPLSFAIVLLLLEIFWPERKRIEKPAATAIASGNDDLRKAVAALVVSLVTLPAAASSHSALRQYEQGKFSEAQQEFQRLAEKRPQDARLRYNAGAAAYQAKKFDEAAEHFMAAIDPNNLELQQRAHYNLGNTLYRAGEQQDDPQQKTASWEQAVKGYESALKLNAQDPDAKFNLELVKQRLEELRQQQKQDQKKDDQQNDKKDDSKDDKNQGQKESEQKEKQDQPKENEQKQDQQKSEQQKKEEQKQNEQKQKQADQNKDQPQDKGSQRYGDKSEKDQKEEGQSSAAPGQMTKEQVEKLLNALRSDEKAMIFRPPQDARSRNRIYRDW